MDTVSGRTIAIADAQRPVEPEDVATAIVEALDTPKTHLSALAPLRFVGAVTSMLGPRGRRWPSKQMGSDHVFLDVDPTARKAYEDRAQTAQRVLETDGRPQNNGSVT